MGENKNKNGIIAIVAIIAIALIVAVVYFAFIKGNNNNEQNQQVIEGKNIWKSGKIRILDGEITLPCSVLDFEKTFNVTIIKSEYEKWTSIEGHKIKFLLSENEDMITGVTDGSRLSYETKYTSSIIYFPGDIQLGDNIEKVKEIYTKKNLNTATKNRYNYTDQREWQIVFHTDDDGVIEEINYFYLNYDK